MRLLISVGRQRWPFLLLVLVGFAVGCQAPASGSFDGTGVAVSDTGRPTAADGRVGGDLSPVSELRAGAVPASTPSLVATVPSAGGVTATLTTAVPAIPTTIATAIAPATATATGTPTSTASPTEPATSTPIATAVSAPSPPPTPDGIRRQVRLPILMYHYLSEPLPDADRYRRDLSVSPGLFEQHLVYLQAEGYQAISLYDLLYHLSQGRSLPDKPVIITFDDGYLDNFEHAFPLLQRYGVTATFFVVTELAGYQGVPSYMSWDQLREMTEAGMDVECHARVHEDLTENDADRLVWQVLGCREMIEAELGQRPRFIAYPGGSYDANVIALFASDNYWGGITTRQGNLHDSDRLFEIKRLRVRNTTTVEDLAELLTWEEGAE